ncbi:hypothetical protein EOK75_03385 [Pseudorhodobacter turbinis]|uniref:DUF2497 domain-containing protein n=1 Tax=Pseudorhodobacter turbinis TaxID=2500533 RepID=A0A4P8EDA9_9RHOB|nr:hypothetical protein [Pseudorhodobacter turbinis]QCO54910.1 hypothetical protein EOK75_03385 [Pseudorhodobacter turbinis]
MSEPMSSGEIEDVLSSIRRLVTEDLRPAAPSPSEEPVGKLLLTPALRVVSGEPVEPSRQPARPKAKSPAAEEPQTQAQADMARVLSEIRAAVAGTHQEWEPENGDGPMAPVSWQAPEWVPEAEVVPPKGDGRRATEKEIADAAEAAAVAEITARMAAEAAPADAGQLGGIDDKVLRDLVRDLIREELSGSLGERITRNVRKLVRAEINRAITARNLD